MKHTTKAAEKSTVKITLKFDATEWKEALNKAYMKTRGKFAINGFRKGKAPKNVIENVYGKGVFFEDALNLLFSENYPTVIEKAARLCHSLIANHSFVDGNKCTVTLCNPTNELLENIKIAIKTDYESVTCYTMDGSSYMLVGEPSHNKGYKLFAIEKIPSSEMVLIET